ncbi:MAG: hypothetical protein PUJ55_02515 [Clostridiales bacterium]|nr:hypothetical protein [Roseburia sp.]MDD7635795.1 hypothetical protein [Clostridiales bacterium]MDY4112126.1 hypothetical protein [Roseburia sp.]
MEYHVHVGFGFHVNCYHSYRGDTCDALGFGGDIRIIRHIIDCLDAWNEKGVPVKGTWDFENAYSLEEILPVYAPDIIERIKKRQNERGDENILMGYNNGAMSAMTEEEFFASVDWAIMNEHGSGLCDIFGSCERIIRPQEVMFTPSQAKLYRKAGIKAVCLYYSCIPFDAFRTLMPQLPDEWAFNPLTYAYEGEEITVLPTYSNSDLMDAGSLAWLVTDLHERQLRGEINKDVFVFINIDADSFLWEPLPVPGFMRKLPNFNGISGLIEEIAGLSFVRFDTPGGYLRNHEPAGKITFGEDVADGNFSGYASWAEKPFNRQIWSRLERVRAYAACADREKKGVSFEERVRLLSTTHFGLASPVMNIVREQKALALSEEMLKKERVLQETNAGDTAPETDWNESEIVITQASDSTFLGIQLLFEKGYCSDIVAVHVTGELLKCYTLIPMDTWEDDSIKTFYLMARMAERAGEYRLHFSVTDAVDECGTEKRARSTEENEADHQTQDVVSGGLQIRVDERSGFPLICDGEGTFGVWKSWIDYAGELVSFAHPKQSEVRLGGSGRGVAFCGEIHLPGEISAGSYEFVFLTSPAIEGIILHSRVQYPYTFENHEISTQASNLGRYSDVKWRQTAPMELTFSFSDEVVLEKRNFMQAISDYPLSDFWQSFEQNAHISSFNHQLTGGMLRLRDDKRGIVLAHARQVLGSMAHCPMRLAGSEGRREVSMNPFGTYFGEQRYYPSRGNGCVMALYNTTMPQARSIAPAYNGADERGIQLLLAAEPGERKMEDICAFADGAVRVSEQGAVHVYAGDNVRLHEANAKTQDAAGLKAVSASGVTVPELLGMVCRYLQNLRSAQKKLRQSRKNEKIMEKPCK